MSQDNKERDCGSSGIDGLNTQILEKYKNRWENVRQKTNRHIKIEIKLNSISTQIKLNYTSKKIL